MNRLLRWASLAVLVCTNQLLAQDDGRSTYHLFPQEAYGRLADGSSYQSTLFLNNASGSTVICTLVRNNGLTSQLSLRANEWNLSQNDTTGPFASGYVSVECSNQVFASMVYSNISATGKTVAEATVFSSPVATRFNLLADQRGGKRLGLAIANDLDVSQTVAIEVLDSGGRRSLGKASHRVSERSSLAGYVNELTGWSGSTLAQIVITCDRGCSVIGLRFSDAVFTTIPPMVLGGRCADTPRMDSLGAKPNNQTQTERLCGNWRFTAPELVFPLTFNFARVFENLSQPGEYWASGASGSNVALSGYDPIKRQFWIGLTPASPTLTFTFVGDETVTGCYYISGFYGPTCSPLAGSRAK